MTAAGSGCMAALAAERYLNENDMLQEFHQRQVRPPLPRSAVGFLDFSTSPQFSRLRLLALNYKPRLQASDGIKVTLFEHRALPFLALCCDACVKESETMVKV